MKKRRRKSEFKRTVEYLCTRKRILSLIVGVLSVAVAAAYIVLSVACIFNIDNVKESVKGLWGFKYIANVGLYTLFSVLGIILFFVLGLYRGMMSYFYFKIYGCDVKFFKERLRDTILFSAFSFVMAGIYFFLYAKEGFSFPFLTSGVLLTGAVIYLIFGIVPIIERIICSSVVKAMERESRRKVPVKEEIFDELETDAENEVQKTMFKNGKSETFPKAVKTGEKDEKNNGSDEFNDVFDHSEEDRITKNYGKAAGRLARKFKDIEDDED